MCNKPSTMGIDPAVLKMFSGIWNTSATEDRCGQVVDYQFLQESTWLQDAAVIERIMPHKGKWAISLVFANPRQTSFIVRFIRSSMSLQKARIEAQYLRRTAAKDPRGTVTISADLFQCSKN